MKVPNIGFVVSVHVNSQRGNSRLALNGRPATAAELVSAGCCSIDQLSLPSFNNMLPDSAKTVARLYNVVGQEATQEQAAVVMVRFHKFDL